jgi:DNA replication protein
MNSIAKLIKAKTIDFTQVLIKHYKAIGLNETSAVIVSKLYYLADENDNFLSVEKLVQEVTLNEELLSMEIINLVSNGYIELSVDNNGRETFTLDGTIEKLGVVLEAISNGNCASLRQEKLSLIVNYVETTYQRLCTAQDLVIINSWIDNNCDYEDIKEAVLKSFKMGKMNLKYAEAILYSKSRREVKAEIEVDDELKALLDGAYVKK